MHAAPGATTTAIIVGVGVGTAMLRALVGPAVADTTTREVPREERVTAPPVRKSGCLSLSRTRPVRENHDAARPADRASLQPDGRVSVRWTGAWAVRTGLRAE